MTKVLKPSGSGCPHYPSKVHADGSIECLRCGFHVSYKEDKMGSAAKRVTSEAFKTITYYPKGTKVLVEAIVDSVDDDGAVNLLMGHIGSARLHTEQVVVGIPVSSIKGTFHVS